MTHCDGPCDRNWSDDIDGQHIVGTYQLDGTRHCRYCDDEECKGLAIFNSPYTLYKEEKEDV